jgi:hypothetical protein
VYEKASRKNGLRILVDWASHIRHIIYLIHWP